MEDIKDLLYDDVEAKLNELQTKKINRKKRWKRIKKYVILGVLVCSVFYLLSDFSKVKSLNVSGNRYYKEKEIYEKADLSYHTRYLLVPGFYIKWKLEQDPVIESVTVSKKLNGAIHIEVQEKKIIGYTVLDDGKNYIVMADGTKEEIAEQDLNSIVYYPLLMGFSDEQLAELGKGFDKEGKEVSNEYISMISEIRPFSTSYNQDMVKITMQDGNRLYSSINGIQMLSHYKEVMGRLKEHKVCLLVDETNTAITKSDCLD